MLQLEHFYAANEELSTHTNCHELSIKSFTNYS